MNPAVEFRLKKRAAQGNFRALSKECSLIDFSSNDSLGLATSSVLFLLFQKELEMQGGKLGSTGSRLLTGNSQYAEDLEAHIAAFHGYEAGLLFNCGYMANLGLISAIASENDVVLFDASIHASVRDGIRLSRAHSYPFRHHDLSHLQERLRSLPSSGRRFICVESVTSTDGSLAPLKELVRLAREFNADLIVDEAHAVGVYGPQGQGLTSEYGLTSDVFAQVTTFGKAPGVHGAIVLGSHRLKEALINFSHPLIFTTALPFYALAAIKSTYALFPTLSSERALLQRLIQTYRQLFPAVSPSHIQALAFPGNLVAKAKSQSLRESGFDVRALLSPTVRRGEEMLRVCLHAFNTEEELFALQKELIHVF